MAIDKSLEAVMELIGASGNSDEMGVEVVDPYGMETNDEVIVIEDDDGGVTIDFGGTDTLLGGMDAPFDAKKFFLLAAR
jgi:hypothetical protein